MNQTVTKIYTISLQNIMPSGVYCAEMDSDSQYLIIGSIATSNSNNGLFMFRILNEEPWLSYFQTKLNKESSDLIRLKDTNKMNFSKIEYITKLEISPDNSSLAVIYVSGKICVYAIPSMKVINEWFNTEQVFN